LNSADNPIDQRRGDGEYELREVLRVVLYVRVPHLLCNEAISGAIEDLLQSPAGAQLRYMADSSGDWRAYPREEITRRMRASLVGAAGTINGTLSLTSDPTSSAPDFYLEYNGFAIDRPLFRDRAGFMFFWVPSSWVRSSQELVISTVSALAVHLPISFASADLTIVGKSERAQQLVNRYMGIDVADVSSTAIDLGDRVAGVFWLNVYGPNVAKLVRERYLASDSLQAAWRATELPRGRLMLLADSGPQRGDKNRKEALVDREALAVQLAEGDLLHIPTRSVYFDRTPEDSGEELQMRWHRRYLDLA